MGVIRDGNARVPGHSLNTVRIRSNFYFRPVVAPENGDKQQHHHDHHHHRFIQRQKDLGVGVKPLVASMPPLAMLDATVSDAHSDDRERHRHV